MRPTPGRRVPGLGDPRVDLVPGSWPPSPGLAPWAILIWRSSALTRYSLGHAEAARGHLLDGAAPQVAVGVGREAVGVLAALAGVGAAAEPVHGDGQRLVGLGRDRAVGHGPGGEPGHDGRDRLHLLDRDRAGRSPARSAQQAAQRGQLLGLVVDRLRVLLEDVVALGPGGVLELEHRLRVEEVDTRPRGATGTRRRPRARGGPARSGGRRWARRWRRGHLGRPARRGPTPPIRRRRAGEVLVDQRRGRGRSPRRPGRRCRRPRSRCPSWTSP